MIDNILLLKKNYDNLYKYFIQPKKYKFDMHSFKEQFCEINKSSNYKLINDYIINDQNNKIYYSLFKSDNNNNKKIIIYLHSYNGNRFQSLNIHKVFKKSEYDICAVDSQYFGQSEGKYTTLGDMEADHLKLIIDKIKDHYKILILWGRSMGAVTAMKYLHNNTTTPIKYLILDSPYIKLKYFYENIVKNNIYLPKFISKTIFNNVISKIISKTGCNLDKINCYQYAKEIKLFTIFITSKNDEYVDIKRSNKLYDKILSNHKKIININLKHNEERGDDLNKYILTVLNEQIKSSFFINSNFSFKFLNTTRNPVKNSKSIINKSDIKNKHKEKNYLKESILKKSNTLLNFNLYESSIYSKTKVIEKKENCNISIGIDSYNNKLLVSQNFESINKKISCNRNIKESLNYKELLNKKANNFIENKNKINGIAISKKINISTSMNKTKLNDYKNTLKMKKLVKPDIQKYKL